MFFLSNVAKIEQLKRNLQMNLEAVFIENRNEYLRVYSICYRTSDETGKENILNYLRDELNNTIHKDELKIILSRHPLLQVKEYFAPTSDKFLNTIHENPEAYLNRIEALFMHYRELSSLALKLNEISDSKGILKLAENIRDYTTNIPNKWDIQITNFPYYGKDVEVLFFGGIAGMMDAVIALIVGVVVMIPAYFMGISYFGTPTYLLDTTLAFINSFLMTLSFVLLPAALLYAKATTDSYDISKGHHLRMIDSLITLCKNELPPPETQDTSNGSYLAQYESN